MPIDKVSSYTVQALPELKETIQVQQFPPKAITGRDVVLINPFCEGGGDHALANKLANIALEEGCRVTIVPVSTEIETVGNTAHRNISLSKKEHKISELHQPLFIVAPVDILGVDDLENILKNLCTQYKFKKQDIILLEEMDIITLDDDSLEQREEMLKQIGFKDISACKLGFENGAIGYLPINNESINIIKNRMEGELTKLLDSYNFSLKKTSRYHLGYISCECINAAKLFIANTLSETKNSESDDNFVMVTRSLKEHEKEPLKNAIKNLLSVSNQKYNFPSLFSDVSLYFSDPETGKLQSALKIQGTGERKIQIVFAKALPENIFKDFMCLSHSGMASGDQSLGEFLSLTGKLPYYDRQTWKAPLARAFEKIAESVGGDALRQAVSQKIVGPSLYSKGYDYVLAANHNQPAPSPELKASMAALNRHVSAQTADSHIRALLKAAQGASPSASGLEKFN